MIKRIGLFFVVTTALIAAVTLTSTVACCPVIPSAYADDTPTAATTRLHIEGMTCGACATSVKIVLGKIVGVSAARVSFEEKSAVVTYDPAKVTPQQIADMVSAKLPYKATVAAPAGAGK